MHWLLKFAIIVAGNALALWLAWLYVPGFVISDDWVKIVLIAFVLALLNGFLKPLLKLVLAPVIILTLGIGLLLVNGIMLYILPYLVNYIDFLRGSIIFMDIPALVYTTLIVSIINFVIHIAA
jgi:putative membrane protein